MRRLSLVLAIRPCALSTAAQAQRPGTEKIEWTWTDRPETPAIALPNVLLVGDSIAHAFYLEVAEHLSGEANAGLFATSAALGHPCLVWQLGDCFRMMGLSFAVVHFINGMHGWRYTDEVRCATQDFGSMMLLVREDKTAALQEAPTTIMKLFWWADLHS